MKKSNIDCYIVLTEDFHNSEYVGDFFKCREYLSGFNGSAGRIVVTQKRAVLWTDGRYFIQADNQLRGTGIDLYKMGEPGVPDMLQYIIDEAQEGWHVGVDGRTLSAQAATNLKSRLLNKKSKLVLDLDLVGNIWEDRPEISREKIYDLPIEFAGISRKEKIQKIKQILENNNCDYLVVSALDEISYLLNLRGNDISYNPVFLSYLIIPSSDENVELFVMDGVVEESLNSVLENENISIKKYDGIWDEISAIASGKKVMLDMNQVNARIVKNIQDFNGQIVNCISPIMIMKAKKNKTEIENEKKAHLKDGVAVTKLVYWLKHLKDDEKISEMDVVEKIEQLRKEQPGYIEPSFGTISAFGSNAAIIHYEPSENTNSTISKDNFLLVDTGGHYWEGTTDVTRTVAIGKVSGDMKKNYTAVLIGNLRLAATQFMYGCRGTNLDVIAREPLWKRGLDYKHGTGHGVGYLLNVHESPNNFRWKINTMNINRNDAVLEEGMITSDEPGVYIEGEYGIRLENMILCIKDIENEYGQFMKFDTLTLVPFDIEAIDKNEMTDMDIELLNAYHARVRKEISPFLNDNEKSWLEEVTKPLLK